MLCEYASIKRMFNITYKNYNTSFLSIAKRHWRTTMPFISIKKILNVLLSILEKKQGKIILNSKPFFIKIEPTNRCNLRCKGCLHADGRPELKQKGILGQIDFSLFKKIVDELDQYLLKVSLYSMGEPLLYPNIAEMIKYLSDKNIGSTISSNLNYLPKELAKKIVRNQLTHLIISLDGPNKKTYNNYRIGGNFEKVISNIKLICSEKKNQNSKYPVIEIQMIKFKHTKQEDIIKMKKLVKELGANRLNLKDDVSPRYYKPAPVEGKCFWLYGNPSISSDGDLEPCCNFYKHKNQSFGDTTKNSINEIYNNEKYQNAREYFKTGKIKEPNLKCHNCAFFKKTKK